MLFRYSIVLPLLISLIGGCSGIKTYPNSPIKNLHVEVETDADSLFSSVRAAVDIYRVDSYCKTEYEGTVQFKYPSVDLGIPPGRSSYLVFVYTRSSFLSNSTGTVRYDVLLTPHPAYKYNAKVRYVDNIYNVEISEIQPDSGKIREIELKGLNTCHAY